jgi:hypothetical protein
MDDYKKEILNAAGCLCKRCNLRYRRKKQASRRAARARFKREIQRIRKGV